MQNSPCQPTSGHSRRSPLRAALPGILVVGTAIIALAAYRWARLEKTSSMQGATPVALHDVIDSGAARGFNLLLVTLDTTRPDRLGCYGYAAAATPTIDSLVERGVRFDNAVTSVPITLPSHAVMMTGKYPPTTGVRYNGTDRLTERHVTLAEKLKQAGYATAAFVSAFVLDRRFGLDQGFDTYDFGISPDLERHMLTLHNERRADDVTKSALDWLKQHPTGDPFFLWVHYFDPHAPHVSPLASLERFRNRPYDAEIAFVDTQLRRLIEHLEKSGMRDRTLIVLATDHGEALGEHGEAYHLVFIYEATMHAAIVLSCPGLFNGAYCVNDRVVGLVDLYPTLVDLFGLTADRGLDGISLLSRDWPRDRAIYLETTYPGEIGCGPLFGLRRRHDKFILAPRAEYYDLRTDAHERNNLIAERPTQSDQLRTRLHEMMNAWPEHASQSSLLKLAPEDVQRLAALGYVTSSTTGATDAQRDCDPKDHIEVINGMSLMKQRVASGARDEAMQLGRELAAAAEGWAEPVRTLASLYVEQNRWDDAIRVLHEFVKKHPQPDMVFRLASAYDHEGRDEECERTLDAAERLAPHLGAVPMLRGDRALRRNQFVKALRYFEKALALDPERLGPDVRPRIYDVRRRLEDVEP